MKTKYLIRLDDACPTMNHEKWGRMENMLDLFGIKPMVGVIPYNQDPKQMIDQEDTGFWDLVKSWESKGWAVALHGYNHCYISDGGMNGLNPMWKKSEFAGVSQEIQIEKIKKGMAILKEHGIKPNYFFAPSHTFDENTLIALRKGSDIRVISDTIAIKPYRKDDFVFIPQQSGHPVSIPFGGYVTICYHPNTMDDKSFKKLDLFLTKKSDDILSFDQLDLNKVSEKGFLDKLLNWIYFLRRKSR